MNPQPDGTPLWLLIPAVIVVGLLSVVFAAGAAAAPSFKVEVAHAPTTINRGDEWVEYAVDLSNVAAPVTEPQPGETFTCNPNTWTPAAAATHPSVSYQWLRNGQPVGSATAPTYKLQATDAGTAIQCAVTGTNPYAATTETTAPIIVSPEPTPAPPGPAEPTAESSRPTITPTTPASAPAGTVLTCHEPANWTDATSFSYQWYRNGAPIAGATEAEYTIQNEDVSPASVLQCAALGSNAGGAALAYSNVRKAGRFVLPANPPQNSAAHSPGLTSSAATSGPTTLAIGLPAGARLAEKVAGGEWTCHRTASSCTISASVEPGSAFQPLRLGVWLSAEALPEVVTSTFTAFGGGAEVEAVAQDSFTLGPQTPFGLTGFSALAEDAAGNAFTPAGGHPYSASTTFALAVHAGSGRTSSGLTVSVPTEALRDAIVGLPPGFIANPQAIPASCTITQLISLECPLASAVGGIDAEVLNSANVQPEHVLHPIYKVVPESGYPAELAFTVVNTVFVLRAEVRSNGDYGISAVAPLTPQQPQLMGAKATLCGFGVRASVSVFIERFEGCRPATEPDASPEPFLRNPTDCGGGAPVTTIDIDSFQHPGAKGEGGFPDLSDHNWKSYEAEAPELTGCEALTEAWVGRGAHPNEPSLTFQPEVTQAETPSGYSVDLHVPQDGLKDPNGLATADLDGTTVTLPRGVALSPSAANGLQACSEAQMGLTSESPLHFNLEEPKCPDASKVGTLEVDTPLLEDPLKGSIYLAAQDANPFHSKFAIYLAVDDEKTGIVIKLAGRVTPDPVTGQITATFENNPQLPFEDFKLNFFGGSRASLINPSTCGAYTTHTKLTPWSAVDPAHPTAAETATPGDRFSIASGPGGGACAATPQARPFAPGLSAGTESRAAGAHSPFVLHLTRNDGEQEFSSLDVALPPGLTATLAGVPYCSAAEIAAAGSRSGAAERAHPSCPSASRIGTVTTAAGAGPDPYYVTGNAYLAGPYKGAPLSVAFVTPAVAGPFDLGNVDVRAGLYVDPETARVTVRTDPIPQILEGVPLRIRSIVARIDRPGFMLNPTNCEPMALGASVAGSSGATAHPANRFQVGGCGNLRFHPHLKLRLKGATGRTGHPSLKAVVTARPGEANIRRAQVNLPHGEFLDQGNLNKTCTRPVLLAGNCPKSSIYGRARAWTPLLSHPLEGYVYLVGGYGYKLPALVADLNGQVRVTLVGKVDSGKNKGIRNTFEVVPDAPVSRFVLRMKGGKKYGLLQNSENLCKAKKARRRAIVRLVGQNNKVRQWRPLVTNQCRKHRKKVKKRAAHSGSRKKALKAVDSHGARLGQVSLRRLAGSAS